MPTNDFLPYISHHGILGQKWGVRRYQNADGSLTSAGRKRYSEEYTLGRTLKKGTVVNSVRGYSTKDLLDSVDRNETGADYAQKNIDNNRWLYTYNPNSKEDSQIYKGPFSYYLRTGRGKEHVVEHQYAAVKDLKIATKDDKMNAFMDLYKDKRLSKTVGKELISHKNYLISVGHGMSKDLLTVSDKTFKNPSTAEEYEKGYNVLNAMMEKSYAYVTTQKYSGILSKNFDATIDDYNKDVYNGAKEPLIIFNPKKTLKSLDSSYVEDSSIIKNLKIVMLRNKKHGRPTRL